MTQPLSAEDLQEALTRRADNAEHFGQFEAVADIRIGNALGYTVGHPVGMDVVEKFKLEDLGLVKRVRDVKEAREIGAATPEDYLALGFVPPDDLSKSKPATKAAATKKTEN